MWIRAALHQGVLQSLQCIKLRPSKSTHTLISQDAQSLSLSFIFLLQFSIAEVRYNGLQAIVFYTLAIVSSQVMQYPVLIIYFKAHFCYYSGVNKLMRFSRKES